MLDALQGVVAAMALREQQRRAEVSQRARDAMRLSEETAQLRVQAQMRDMQRTERAAKRAAEELEELAAEELLISEEMMDAEIRAEVPGTLSRTLPLTLVAAAPATAMHMLRMPVVTLTGRMVPQLGVKPQLLIWSLLPAPPQIPNSFRVFSHIEYFPKSHQQLSIWSAPPERVLPIHSPLILCTHP